MLSGHARPLIVAAAEPLASVYRAVSTYPHTASEVIGGSADHTPDHELATAARGVLDGIYAAEIARLAALFAQREPQGRAVADVAQAARAATFGAVDTLIVDMDEVVAGTVDDETGAVTFGAPGKAETYGVVDEIARRTLLAGGRVVSARRAACAGRRRPRGDPALRRLTRARSRSARQKLRDEGRHRLGRGAVAGVVERLRVVGRLEVELHRRDAAGTGLGDVAGRRVDRARGADRDEEVGGGERRVDRSRPSGISPNQTTSGRIAPVCRSPRRSSRPRGRRGSPRAGRTSRSAPSAARRACGGPRRLPACSCRSSMFWVQRNSRPPPASSAASSRAMAAWAAFGWAASRLRRRRL